jgi:hypothetical protein
MVSQRFEAFGRSHFLGIGAIDAINLGALQHGLAVHFHSPQCCGCVCGEEGIAGASGEDDHPPLFHVTDGAAADVGLAHRFHRDGRLHTRGDLHPLQHRLHRQRVHHGREHAHVVSGGALDAFRRASKAPEDVAAADNETHLRAAADGLRYIGAHPVDRLDVDAVVLRAHQGFAGELQKYAGEPRPVMRHLAPAPRAYCPAICFTSSAKSPVGPLSMPSPTA